MINDLNLHSPMIPQANAGVSSEMSLMNLIGKGSSLDESLNQEDLLALLSNDGEMSFSDILSNEEGETKLGSFKELVQNLDKLNLTPEQTKNLKDLINKIDVNGQSIDVAQLVKSSEGSKELENKLKHLAKLSSNNTEANKSLKELSNLIVKDQTTKVNVNNLKDVVENKNKINKMLGLSSEDILNVKKDSKINEPSLLNKVKSNLAKNFDVQDQKIIKNNSSTLGAILSKETKQSTTENEQGLNLDLTSESDNSNMLKLDSSTIIKTNKVNETSKSMDLNQVMSKVNTQNEVIAKIQDYIIQSKVSSEPNVNLTFNHADLGDVNLNVQKITADNLAVTITSNNAEAVKFFTENKSELLQTLTNSGLNISEMKLENTTNTNKDSNSNNQNFSESKQNFSGSKQGEQERESKKREELWELFDKEIA